MQLLKWALGATLALGLAAPAYAADLGGNCCQDLSERVEELERFAARKGNSKVKLIISGQVNKAVLFLDDGSTWTRSVIDNAVSPTVLNITGEGKLSPNVTAGFRLELGINENPAILILQDQVTVRHSVVWLQTQAGKLSVGRTSTATDGIVEITVSNTDVAAKMLNLEPLSSVALFGINLPFDGSRRDIVRYDSPSFGGFHASGSYSPVGGTESVWDAALRYAGEFSGFRLAAGIGYRDEDNNVGLLPTPLPALSTRDRVYGGSASLMHMGTGLFVNVAAAQVNQESALGASDYRGYHVQAGWENRIWAVGKTTVYGEYAVLDFEGASINPNLMGIGVVQALDNAAMDVYLAYRRLDTDTGGPEVQTIMFGTRIRF